MAHFEIYQDAHIDGGYRWKLLDDEERNVAVSEVCFTKKSALRSAEEVIRWAPRADVFDMTL